MTLFPQQSVADRAAGALMGGLIGDALGVGPHWYYDLDELHRDHGAWITGYTTPKPHRYHAGLRAGDSAQSGFIAGLLMQSLIDCQGYDEADFCRRLDGELLVHLDGTPRNGPGGYTSQSIREVFHRRLKQERAWGDVGGYADTTEAAERAFVLAALYHRDVTQLADLTVKNTVLTQIDHTVVAMTTAFVAAVGLCVAGHPFDGQISHRLANGIHGFYGKYHPTPIPRLGGFASPDALLTAGPIAQAARDPAVQIEPAWKVSTVYGMPCAVYHQFPAVYYLAARFHDDFESAVLHAINGGGQNLARALLTGTLVGAQVGLSGIPARFIDGLTDKETRLAQIEALVNLP